MPSGLIDQENCMGARRHRERDFLQVQGHGRRVAEGQDKSGALAEGRADCAEQIDRLGPLVVRRRWPRATLGPTAGNFVLLTDPRFVLPPDFYDFARRPLCRDFVEGDREFFLKVSNASASCAWWRGRADNLRNPMARSSRLSVCTLMDVRNSSNTHCAKSTSRHLTTP
jgi:hypothetical protein